MSSCLLTIGKAIQVTPLKDSNIRTVFIHIGQLTAMLSCPVAFGAPACISATWFLPKERTTATAIAALIPLFGAAMSSVTGPYMVPIRASSHASNVTSKDIEEMRDNITIYLGMQFALSAFFSICVLVYFPDKPPLRPSPGASLPKCFGTIQAFKTLFSDGSYMLLSLLFAVSYGVYFGWYTVLALAVRPFGISESKAGWLSCVAILAGCVSGTIVGRY